ncbi:MAG: sugar ABC transporter permease [Muribaculaceae bacterium]|nr:sugar ABC transporter permease [Roseburia sp.]MCM1431432.1 sugar ABC transporter permease [Muribaculaceae bacterium]MCM1491874.1 sugar ABC transporter permease [Muribaculaceae bacterium]
MGRRRRRAFAGLAFLAPGFLGIAVFYLIPFVDVCRRSFLQTSTGSFCGLENYRRVLDNTAFALAAKNTARFVFVCLPFLLLLSLCLALLVNGLSVKAKALFKSAFLLPMAIPAASVVLLWKLLFDVHGFVNGLLQRWASPVDWLNTRAAFAVLVFSYIWKNLGYTLVLWLAGLLSVPQEVIEAAQIDGAGRIARFFKITLPLIKPMIFTIVVLSLLNSFKVFREAYLVCGNYPQESIYLLQHLFNNWFLGLEVDKLAAGSVLLALVIGGFVGLLAHSWER